ncbi:MAG: hypothetical protein ACREFZ_08480, partial [Acetobacteraceae bacterium]
LHDFEFDDIPQAQVEAVCREVLARAHLKALPAATKRALDRTYTEYMTLFRENIALLGFTIVFLRKTQFPEDPELFSAHPVPKPQQ